MSLTKPLSNLYISESFERLVQIDPTDRSKMLDGTGSVFTIDSTNITNFSTQVSASAAAAGFSALGSTAWGDLTSIPTGILSSSSQISGLMTSSISNFNTEVSRSAAQFGFSSAGVSDYTALSNIPLGIISSSGQTSSIGLGKTDTVEFGTLAISNDIGVAGNVIVQGTLIAREYIVSSSVINVTQSFSSGSTIFGNSSDDTHQMTGSMTISGSLFLNGVAISSGSGTDVSFNGNRTVTRSGLPLVNVGTTTDVMDFLESYFFPFVSATLSISGASTYETGSSQNINITISINENSETSFSNGSLRNLTDDVEVDTFTSDDSATDNGVTYNTNYSASIDVDNNGSPTTIQSNTITANFIYPYFYGMSASGTLSGTSLYNGLNKVVSGAGNKTLSFNGTDEYIYFITPSSWGDVATIYDPNSFDVTTSFTQSTVSVTSTGLSTNYTQDFKMYRSNTITTANGNFTFQF